MKKTWIPPGKEMRSNEELCVFISFLFLFLFNTFVKLSASLSRIQFGGNLSSVSLFWEIPEAHFVVKIRRELAWAKNITLTLLDF